MLTQVTLFTQRILQIKLHQNHDVAAFYTDFINLFDEINKLSVPIKWVESGKKPSVVIFGDVGHGKSTTGNALAKELLRQTNEKFTKNMAF